jgi:hypothetical protein
MSSMNQERAAGITMALTYAVGALGLGIGFSTAFSPSPDLRWACLFAVGLAGLLSFVRHSLMHRGDAARMGWDSGTTNPFQIEVGLANLAWGLLAVIAVALSWGLGVSTWPASRRSRRSAPPPGTRGNGATCCPRAPSPPCSS